MISSLLAFLLVVGVFVAAPIAGQSDPTEPTPPETATTETTNTTTETTTTTTTTNSSSTSTTTQPPPGPEVSLEITDATMSESGGTAIVTATLSTAAQSTVTVRLAFTGTALANSDYAPSANSIQIPAGSLSGSITLSAVQDTLDEDEETAVVAVSSVENAVEAGEQQATATIQDDDEPPVVTLSASVATMSEAGGTSTIAATLGTASGHVVTVHLEYAGTASPTVDYTHGGTSITIPAGATTGSVTLTAVQDTADEPDETIQVSILSVDNGAEDGSQQVAVTIQDDDEPQASPTTTTTTSTSTSTTTTSPSPTNTSTSPSPTNTSTSSTTTTPTTTTRRGGGGGGGGGAPPSPFHPATTPAPVTTTMTTTDSAGREVEVVQTFVPQDDGGTSSANHTSGLRVDPQRPVAGEGAPGMGLPLMVLGLAAAMTIAFARRR